MEPEQAAWVTACGLLLAGLALFAASLIGRKK